MAKRTIKLRPIDIESQLFAAIVVTTLVTLIVYFMAESAMPNSGMSSRAASKASSVDLLIFGNFLLQFALAFFLRWRWPLINCSELRSIPNRFGYGQLFCEVIVRNMLVIVAIFVLFVGDVDITIARSLGMKNPWSSYMILSAGCGAIAVLNHAIKIRLQHPCTDFRRLEGRRNSTPWQRHIIAIGVAVILMGILSYGIPVIAKLTDIENSASKFIERGIVVVAMYILYTLLINSRPRPSIAS